MTNKGKDLKDYYMSPARDQRFLKRQPTFKRDPEIDRILKESGRDATRGKKDRTLSACEQTEAVLDHTQLKRLFPSGEGHSPGPSGDGLQTGEEGQPTLLYPL